MAHQLILKDQEIIVFIDSIFSDIFHMFMYD